MHKQFYHAFSIYCFSLNNACVYASFLIVATTTTKCTLETNEYIY